MEKQTTARQITLEEPACFPYVNSLSGPSAQSKTFKPWKHGRKVIEEWERREYRKKGRKEGEWLPERYHFTPDAKTKL